MPFLWFRRKKGAEQEAAREEAAPEAPEHVTLEAAPEAEAETATKPKRRRGSRGGRSRKRASDTKAADAASDERPQGEPDRELETADKDKAEKPAPARRRSTRRRQPARRPPLPAAKRELLVSVGVAEQRVAVLEDDRVAEVYLERPERRSIAGNIYKGVVDNVLPGMEAAFVEIGLEKNGFLYVDEIVGPELEGKRPGRRIQDLISRGQEIIVQAVKDPMKSKGARLTTEISLPGRFVVFVPYGEGLGVSRRLDDDERTRLRDIIKRLDPKEGGVIIRTAAEGASAEDIERDLVFLQRLWKTIDARARELKAPALVYQEAELPLRVVRDLFTEDFERALVDHDRTFKRVVGYLKKTSPHMAERVVRHKERESLFDHYGVESEIRSTVSRRVDLPSGGYLIFDYAEAFTVVDVNTGRFVGSRSKGSGARLEDTITKNNLEAVKEVVRQLRLRDIGGIIVIDFIDMANPKNRQLVEEALKNELERDRTKTYVVEISPLGLVEMTRQNVTEGPREILTKRCPTCSGDGIVLSEASAAVDAERRLRALAAGSRSQAFRVELNPKVAALLIGAGAERLAEIEAQVRRRFFLEPKEGAPLDHLVVVAQGKLADIEPERHPAEGNEIEVKLVEIGLHDVSSGVAKLDGLSVCVADASKLVGKKVKVRVSRVLDGTAYATLVAAQAAPPAPITAEGEAEKPTRAPRSRKALAAAEEPGEVDAATEAVEAVDGTEAAEVYAETPAADEAPKPKTRRGSRGGRGRRKTQQPAAEEAAADATAAPADEDAAAVAEAPVAATDGGGPRIHVPPPELGRDEDDTEAISGEDGAGEKPKKRTRRGSRGGRNRRKKTEAAAEAVSSDGDSDSGYVPMSEWIDEVVGAD